jgi:hypothetical protein
VTLIVSFVSEDFVALASDRRITWEIGGASQRWEDTENKAVVLAGHFLMGYTGFARLGGVKTERWVVEKLCRVEPGFAYFKTLTIETERAVKALGQPLHRSGHAFVAVGYGATRADPEGPLRATCVTVTNALGDGTYGTWTPAPHFTATRIPLLQGSNDFRMNALGVSPPRPVIEEVVDVIRRYRKRHPGRVVGVLQVLVDLVRRVAAHDDRVSKDVSVSVLPRHAVGSSVLTPVRSGLIADPIDTLTCMFVPDGTDTEHAEVYAPAIVTPGMAIYGGEVWSTEPPWWTH